MAKDNDYVDADDLDFEITQEQEEQQVVVPIVAQGPQTADADGRVSEAHNLQQLALMRSRLAFDEHTFRAKLHALQTQANTDMRRIIDKIYDKLDHGIGELTRNIASEHAACVSNVETTIASIREKCLEAAVTDQNTQAFIAYIQQAYAAVWQNDKDE